MQLTDLPGTDGKPREAHSFKRPAEALSRLHAGMAATTAGDRGAINVWRDDEGKTRVEVMRHYCKIAEMSGVADVQIRAFLRKWLREIK